MNPFLERDIEKKVGRMRSKYTMDGWFQKSGDDHQKDV